MMLKKILYIFLYTIISVIMVTAFGTLYNDGGTHTLNTNGTDTSWNIDNSTTLNYNTGTFSVPDINIFNNSTLNITNNATIDFTNITLNGGNSTLNIQNSILNFQTLLPSITTIPQVSGTYHIIINNSSILGNVNARELEIYNADLSITNSIIKNNIRLHNTTTTIENSTIYDSLRIISDPSHVTLINTTIQDGHISYSYVHSGYVKATNLTITSNDNYPALVFASINSTLIIDGGSISSDSPILMMSIAEMNDSNYEFTIKNMTLNVLNIRTFDTSNRIRTMNIGGGGGIINFSNNTVVPYIFDNITINMSTNGQVGIYTETGKIYMGTSNASYSKILAHGFTPLGGLIIGSLPAYFYYSPNPALFKVVGKLDVEGGVYVYDTGILQLGDQNSHVGYIKGDVHLDGVNGLDIYTSGSIAGFDYTPYTQDHLFNQNGSVIDGNLTVSGQTQTLHSAGLFVVTGNLTNNSNPTWDFTSDNEHLVVGGNLSGDSTIKMLWNPSNSLHSSLTVNGDVSGTHQIDIDFTSAPHSLFSNYLLKTGGSNTGTFHLNHQNAGPLLYSSIQRNITFKNADKPDLKLTKNDIFLAILQSHEQGGACVTYQSQLYCENEISLDELLEDQGINPDDVILDGSLVLYKAFFMPLLINTYLVNINEHYYKYNHPQVTINFLSHSMAGSPWHAGNFNMYKYTIDASWPVFSISKNHGGAVFVRFQNITSSTGFVKNSVYPVVGALWSAPLWKLSWDVGVQGGYLHTNVSLPLGALLTGDSNEDLTSWTGGSHLGIGMKMFDLLNTHFIIHNTLSYDYVGGYSTKISELESLISNNTVTMDPSHLVKDRVVFDIESPFNVGLKTYIGQQWTFGSKLHIPPQASVHIPLNEFYYGTGLRYSFYYMTIHLDYQHRTYDQSVALGLSVQANNS